MNASTLKLIGTVLAAALAVVGHLGIVPIPSEATTAIASLIAGWLHLPEPKKDA